MKTDKVERAKALAKKYMREGWGSRASVLHAIYDLFETGVSSETFIEICTILGPFHGVAAAIYDNGRGFGITACGALSGALAAFSMLYGRKQFPSKFWVEGMKPGGWLAKVIDDPAISPEEKVLLYYEHSKQSGYGGYHQIVLRFKEHFGTTDCFDLEKSYGDPVSRACFRNCNEVVIWTAGMVAEVILQYEENPDSLKIAEENVHLAVLRSGQAK